MLKTIETGLLNPITGSKDQVTKKEQQATAILYTVAGIAAGSILARQRAATGKEPILKVFF